MLDPFLDVHMFGKFTVSHDGKEITLGRNTTLKCLQLLQLVWLSGDKGITKEHLINALYERDKVSSINNSLNNLIYQMHLQMARAGLPKENYIVRRGSVFYANEKLTVRVDALEFDKLVHRAQQASTEKEKKELYKQAFDLYEGELLPAISTEMWVMTESLRFKKMFDSCVRWLGGYYNRNEEYNNMYQIYARAAAIYPYDDWQIGQIDSLLSRGEFKQAHLLYTQTAQRYLDEMGVQLSDEMLECYKRMSQKIEYAPKQIEEIRQSLIKENTQDENGTYYCSYPGFVDAYHVLARNMERTGKSIFLMLCTLVDYEGKMITNQEKLTRRSAVLNEVIRESLRKGDVYTRYNKSQYLILLIGIKQEDCKIVYRRISQKLKEKAGPRAGILYSVSSLAAPLSDTHPNRKFKPGKSASSVKETRIKK
jgi:DNA-binding SARP family transcriptional activator